MNQNTATSDRRGDRDRAADLAQNHGGLVSREMLLTAGISVDRIATEIRSGYWERLGRNTLGVLTRRIDDGNRPCWAVWDSGAGAVLDRESALIAAGLKNSKLTDVQILAPGGRRHAKLPGVQRMTTNLLIAAHGGTVPRLLPVWAAIRAAQYARSHRSAGTVLSMAVQQGVVAGADLLAAWGTVRRSPRREIMDGLVRDIAGGSESLSEIDFARMCREWGIPEPTRQVVRKTTSGTYVLDAAWSELDLAVEIDGAQHYWGLAPVDDALRQNALILQGMHVIRIPAMGLRLEPYKFMGQVRAAVAQRGGLAA